MRKALTFLVPRFRLSCRSVRSLWQGAGPLPGMITGDIT